MDDGLAGISTLSGLRAKCGTPNKHWKSEYDDFLIPIFAEHVNNGLKCDKSFKKPSFVYVSNVVNAKFKIDFIVDNVENHYITLKLRYSE